MFKIGDEVLISRIGGYPWVKYMDCMVGYRGQIMEIVEESNPGSRSGFSYKVVTNHPDDIRANNGYWYPAESLEKIEER